MITNGRRPSYWNSTSCFRLTFSGMWSFIGFQNLTQIVPPPNRTTRYDVKMADTAAQIYFRFLIWSRQAFMDRSNSFFRPNLDEISQSTLRYYSLRFLKRNGRHIGILLPVSILTSLLSAAYGFAPANQILFKSDHLSWVTTSRRFSRWRLQRRKCTSGFELVG